MKISNIELVNIANMLEYYGAMKLPQRISYAITKNSMIISKEYKVYETELKKIFSQYEEYFLKDSDGNVQYSSSGIPLVSPDKKDEFNECIAELLSIEVEIELYAIDDSTFEYDDVDGKYDALSAKDIISLQSILCTKEK